MVEGGDYHIKYDNSNKKKEYKLKKGNEIIAKVICVPTKFIDGYITKYIIEYDNIENEKEIILLTSMLNILV